MKMTKFEDVKHMSTAQYFNGNAFSIDAVEKKYVQTKPEGGKETYPEAVWRVCVYIASCEATEELAKYWAERWFSEIYNDWWKPAGSIMQGAGCGKNISMANCTEISLGKRKDNEEWDSLEGIIRNTAYTVAKTAAYRQGLGVDFSRLRPKGCEVWNSSNESQGVIHWMKFIDSIGNYIGQKGRIPAMLFSLDVNHPDIIEFIKCKSDYVSIQNANISVQTNNAFYKAVEEDADWEMSFKIPGVKKGDLVEIDIHSADMDSVFKDGKYYKVAPKNRKEEVVKRTEKARTILELIAKGMYTYGEPGIQQIDMARYWSNSDYVYDPQDICDSRIQATNACSEQYLSRDSLCVLASINVIKFSVIKSEYQKQLKKIGYSINRFLDNVNEMELIGQTYATPFQKLAIQKLRRTGAGMTNIAGWLFKQNLEYGSVEGNEVMFEFNKTYNFYLYESSISLGKEKGNFGLFKKEKFIQSPFVQEMMKLGLEFDTMRNVTCSSIAPTGTLSTQFRDMTMSFGTEPAFGLYFWKRTRMSGKYVYYFCVPHIVRETFEKAGHPIPMESDTFLDNWNGDLGRPIAEFIEQNKDKTNIKFKTSTQINALDKLDLMSKLMKYVDSSISVTYLLSEDSTWQDVYNFILEANKKGVKSIAAFPDKKMYGIVSFIPFKELAFKLKSEKINMHEANFSEEEQKELNVFGDKIVEISHLPKRRDKLEANIHFITADGSKHIIVVGLHDGKPFELFGGLVKEGISFKKDFKHGFLTKIPNKKGDKSRYKLEIGDEFVVEDFGKYFEPYEQGFFRMVSCALQAGAPIKAIVEQSNKASDDMFSLASAAARILKKYIKDGEIASGICKECGSTLIYENGCMSCSTCGWSKGCG